MDGEGLGQPGAGQVTALCTLGAPAGGLEQTAYRGQVGCRGELWGLGEQRAQACPKGRPHVGSLLLLPRGERARVPELLALQEKEIQMCA